MNTKQYRIILKDMTDAALLSLLRDVEAAWKGGRTPTNADLCDDDLQTLKAFRTEIRDEMDRRTEEKENRP